MAVNIKSLPVGIYAQSGNGFPTHVSPKGSEYCDLNTAIVYINKDGVNTWVQEIDSTGGVINGPTIFTNGLTANTISATSINQVDYIDFNTGATVTNAVGRLKWNDADGTLDLGLKGGNVTLQVGQESVARVVNKTSPLVDLLEANYQVVYVSGAVGQRLGVKLAQANNDISSAGTLGVVTETILKNQEGFITTFGEVREINTTGSLQGETWSDGDILYVSPTTAGKITNVKPIAPQHLISVGYVEYAHAIHGKIFVKVDNGYELDELHNVIITGTTANNAVLSYNASQLIWEPRVLPTIGQVLKDTMLANNELTVSATTIATSTTDTDFVVYNYTPVSSTSYLVIHYHLADYDFSSDSGNDSYFSRIKVGGIEITYSKQSTVNGNRTGVLFPLSGRYTNSNTTPKSIIVACRRDSADNSINIINSPTSMWLRITEIGR